MEKGRKITATCKMTYIEKRLLPTVLSEPLDEIFLVGEYIILLTFNFILERCARTCFGLSIQFTGGKERKKLEFTLRGINDVRLPCCLWCNLAELLYSSFKEEDGMVDNFKSLTHLTLLKYSGDTSLTMIQGNEVMPMENNNQLEFSVISD
ncbi:unnamed protein product [Brassica rapa]|uniref:DUF223 domain-containing protein n=1 Tax=Brassica campestris TaxID=3711 RepID=A0A3P5YG49_BRACM|nr:unnamed protein product [Brassica rapa]VDC66712.1 unnamed protein product [Brassica rapa]